MVELFVVKRKVKYRMLAYGREIMLQFLHHKLFNNGNKIRFDTQNRCDLQIYQNASERDTHKAEYIDRYRIQLKKDRARLERAEEGIVYTKKARNSMDFLILSVKKKENNSIFLQPPSVFRRASISFARI